MTDSAEPVRTADSGHKTRRVTDPVRQCALTREEKPARHMLRFVLGPDATIAPDITGKLGGRGVWLTATRQAVEQAIKRNVFSKSLKMQTKPPENLADMVELQLQVRVRQALAFANKAGLVSTGFTKVEKAVEAGQVILLIEAADAAADGADKLRRKFLAISTAANRPAMLSKTLRIAELSLAIGRPNVVHAALAEGGQARAFYRECRRLERFQASGEASSALTDSVCEANSEVIDEGLTKAVPGGNSSADNQA